MDDSDGCGLGLKSLIITRGLGLKSLITRVEMDGIDGMESMMERNGARDLPTTQRDEGRRKQTNKHVVMKVARTKAQLKHLKTKRKKAALKKKRRTERSREAMLAAAGGMNEVSMEDGDEETVGEQEDGNGTNGMRTTSGRMKKSAVTNRKRELRERVADLKSKRSKIPKSNFAKRDERKALSEEIKRLERERAELARGGGGEAAMMADGGGGEDDDGVEEMAT